MGMSVGQAYSKLLSARERKVLAAGCDVLIDQVFDALQEIKEPRDVAHTTLGLCLPPRYVYKYTPFFCRRFLVYLVTVAWKLAQPKRTLLPSVAEELAAAAIIEQSRAVLELESGQAEEGAFVNFIEGFFEDTDFELLFDGIDQTPVAEMIGIASLAL